jgi:hypothetical protein
MNSSRRVLQATPDGRVQAAPGVRAAAAARLPPMFKLVQGSL